MTTQCWIKVIDRFGKSWGQFNVTMRLMIDLEKSQTTKVTIMLMIDLRKLKKQPNGCNYVNDRCI